MVEFVQALKANQMIEFKARLRSFDLLLVDDILDIRRLDAGVMAVHRQVVSLDEILKKVVHVLQQKAQPRNVELSIELDADLPAIFVDAEKASRVILNLGMNAIKYCGEPGRVCIAAVPEQDALRVMVTDNGAGIPTADVVKIFQRFYQRETDDWKSTRGFGLGLGIARELVELNFGSIGLSSGPSQGTEFSFTVPIAGLANILRSYSNHIGTHFPNITRVRVYRLLPSTDIKITPKIDSFLCRCLHTAEILIPFENGWLLVSDACMEGKTLDRIQAIIDRRVTTRSSTSIRGLQTKQVFQGRVCDLSSSISGSLRWS
jgi:two-component sensor histidine kinase